MVALDGLQKKGFVKKAGQDWMVSNFNGSSPTPHPYHPAISLALDQDQEMIPIGSEYDPAGGSEYDPPRITKRSYEDQGMILDWQLTAETTKVIGPKNYKNYKNNDKNNKKGGRKKTPPPPDIPPWISWNKESKDLEITDENKRWLAHELRLHTDWLDAHDPPARGYFPKPFELQESVRNLRGHLISYPFKTAQRSLPTFALNWFKNDLSDARRRSGRARTGTSPAEKSEAAFQEAFRLIKQHKEMTDARKADQDRRDAPAISEGISKLKPDG